MSPRIIHKTFPSNSILKVAPIHTHYSLDTPSPEWIGGANSSASSGMHLVSVDLVDVYLISVHLIGVHLTGMYLIGVYRHVSYEYVSNRHAFGRHVSYRHI
jgi:hypothetical protein